MNRRQSLSVLVLAIALVAGLLAPGLEAARAARRKGRSKRRVVATHAVPKREAVRAAISVEGGKAIREGSEIYLLVFPVAGEGFVRLAQRFCEKGESATAAIRLANAEQSSPQRGRGVRIPLATLRPEQRRDVLDALFPKDDVDDEGTRIHVVGSEARLADPMGAIAAWFTGDPANRGQLRLLSGAKGKRGRGKEAPLRPGDRIAIPTDFLDPALAEEPAEEEATEDLPRAIETEPAPSPPPGRMPPLEGPTPFVGPAPRSFVSEGEQHAPMPEDVLEYLVDERGAYAEYRLKPGEALYSSVVIRFTGRVHASDVNELASAIACRSDIADVTDIPIGFPVKIPVEWLTPEWLPGGDPRRVAWERSLAQAARFHSAARVTALAGVHVILDAGHGGRDVGTSHAGAWESTYVYDIYCRIRALLEGTTRARVWPTVEDDAKKFRILDSDRLPGSKQARLLTNPPYPLEDVVAGVHLRWYLANSRYREVVKSGISPDNVVFLSLHADSLHPSLRGAMVYIPGERLLARGFGKKGEVYENREEWKAEPFVSFTPYERFQSEGYSRDLAAHLLDGLGGKGLGIHRWDPIRASVIRKRKEWLPAVLKFNRVPARALIEVCNMGNPDDRALLVTRAWRQQIAEAIVDGLRSYYEGRPVRSEGN
jgi:N-acetylmuramoyl-L-alanine amidase